MEQVELLGVFPVGPEHHLCAVLQRPLNGRVIPVWLPPFEGAQLAARISGWAPNRPRTIDVLVEAFTLLGSGVNTVELSSYVDGVFMATITTIDGHELDARASDALLLALELGLEISVDESVANMASIYLGQEDAKAMFGTDVAFSQPEEDETSASGDAQADQDFEELMRNLGVEELDLGDDDPGADGTNVTGD